MIRDPVRLLSDDGATAAERELLEAGRDIGPPSGAKSEVWAMLGGKLPPPPPPPPTPGPGLISAWKAGAIGAAVGLLVAGGATLIDLPRGESKAPPVETAAVAAAPQLAVVEVTEPDPIAPSTDPPTEPMPARQARPIAAEEAAEPVAVAELPPAPETPEERKSRLREESRLLREARSALRSGNAARALSLLEESRKKHSTLVLGQEHEALSIEALFANGARGAARERARAFVVRFPNSPHSSKLETIAGSP